MGANYVSFNARGTVDQIRKDFEAAQQQDLYENGHSYSGGIGMARGLKFHASSFKSDREADEWLMDHAQKWEAAIAVNVTTEEKIFDHVRIGAWCSS